MLPGRAGLNADEAIYLRFARRFLDLARRPYHEVHHQLEALKRDGNRIPGYAVLSFLSFADEQGAWQEPILARRDTMTAKVALAQAALAVKAYQAQTGRTPRSLSEVQKTLGWKLREDPFTGRALRYRADDKGFLIYSIGWDLRDNHGRPEKSDYTTLPGDLTWRGTWEPVVWIEAPEPAMPQSGQGPPGDAPSGLSP